jgi:hypothetical protein
MLLDLVYSHPQILIKSPQVNAILQPGETKDLEINAFIPKDNLPTDHLVLMFRLRTFEAYIGQPLIAFLRLKDRVQS